MLFISINLQARRKYLGMTLEDVGKLTGVGKSTVRKWENGFISNMGRDKILKYSNALKISPMEIVDPEHLLKSESTIEKTVSVMNKLTGSQQERIYGFALSQLDEQEK